MAEPQKPRIVPPQNPHVLHPKQSKPKLMAIGGKAGLALWIFTAITLCVVGTMAWTRYGRIVKKLVDRNTSTSYPSRSLFIESRIAEVEQAGTSRRFGFYSPWFPEGQVLRMHRDGDTLIVDASDAKDNNGARDAAKRLPIFQQPGADLEHLTVRFEKPRDPKAVAQAIGALLEAVMDAPPEGGANDTIQFNDAPEKKK